MLHIDLICYEKPPVPQSRYLTIDIGRFVLFGFLRYHKRRDLPFLSKGEKKNYEKSLRKCSTARFRRRRPSHSNPAATRENRAERLKCARPRLWNGLFDDGGRRGRGQVRSGEQNKKQKNSEKINNGINTDINVTVTIFDVISSSDK
ncbi:hypothetical protein EXVG_00297 [Emiliania huxleyi virus 202]|nr:hypothetical protein EXVG_00297 [Emiliania huxleyi virus 202]